MRIKRADHQRYNAEEQVGNIDVQVIYVVFYRGHLAVLQISGEHQKQRHTGRRQQPQPGQQIAAHTGYVVCRQAAVADAKAAFDGLTDEKKAIIPADMIAKLEKAVDDIATIVVVNPVIDAIEALADPDTVSYENLETVKAAAATVREALDALNDTQKDKVVNASKLEAVEAKIAELEGDKQTADAVANAINALPSLEEMTADKVADVTVAGIQFDALTEAQKALISEELKNKLAALREWAPVADVVYGDLNGDGEVTVDDALIALQGAVGKIELTDAQIEAADVDGEAGVGVSDALAILQKAVGKVETLPLVVE